MENLGKPTPKKPTAAQLAARKKFAAMAKSGDLQKKREAAAKKKKTGLKKPVTKGLTTLCAKTVGTNGRKKKDGTLKKGMIIKKGGKITKAPVKKVLKKK